MTVMRFTHEHRGGLKYSAVFIDNKPLVFDGNNIAHADLESARIYNVAWRIMGPEDASLVVVHLDRENVIVDSVIREEDIETPPDGRRSTFSFFQA